MVIYRPHRGALAESMLEAREFESVEAMKRHIVDEWRAYYDWSDEKPFDVDDIVVDEVMGDDDRIGWNDVRYVCIKRLNNEDYMKLYGTPQCIGYCSENYERK